MPQTAPITAYDGENTPVLHTFNPDGRDAQGVVFRWKESDGTPLGDNVLTISKRNVADKTKVRLLLAMPITVDETINGVVVPKVAREAYADLTLTFRDSSNAQERENVLKILGNVLVANSGVFWDVAVDLEGIW